jgi:hypothetical protein
VGSLIERYEQYDLTQFHNWEISPRDDGSQFFMKYFETIEDSSGKLIRRKPLFIVGIDKKYGSIRSNDIGNPEKLIYCQEKKIDTSDFKSHLHKLFKDFLSYNITSLENWKGIYFLKEKNYLIAYSEDSKNEKEILSYSFVKFKDKWYYKHRD